MTDQEYEALKQRAVYHDREYESMAHKIEHHLQLSEAERLVQALEMMTFLCTLNPGKVNLDDRKSYRTVQVIERPSC